MIGILGEQIATNYLKSKNYKIVDRNYFSKYGEIDIIAYFEKTVIFIEVKTRKDDNFVYASESVNYKKIRNIKNTAKDFIFKNSLFNYNIRFDIVECYWKDRKVRHIENAF